MGNAMNLGRAGWTTDYIQPDQVRGKDVIITGASAGLGLETTRVLVRFGARVTMAVRDVQKTAPLLEEIKAQTPDACISVQHLDLEDLESVRTFAQNYRQAHHKLDILMNNAGIYDPAEQRVTKDGLDQQMSSNFYGHWVLTNALLPLLIRTHGSRIVNVSSIHHRDIKTAQEMRTNFDNELKFEAMQGYGRTKLAMNIWGVQLRKALRAAGHAYPLVVAAHPGFTKTKIQYELTPLSTKLVNVFIRPVFGQTVDIGALPQIRAAVGTDVKDGDFFGPQGFKELNGYPVLCQEQPLTFDNELGQWLWNHAFEKTLSTPSFAITNTPPIQAVHADGEVA